MLASPVATIAAATLPEGTPRPTVHQSPSAPLPPGPADASGPEPASTFGLLDLPPIGRHR